TQLEQCSLQLADARTRRAGRREDARNPFVRKLEGWRALEQVALVEHDELRPHLETRSVARELAIDRPEPVLEIGLRGIEDVHEQLRTLEVREELVAKPRSVGGSFDEARNVRDGQLPLLGPVDDAENRLERGERVVGDLRLRVRDPAQQRRLSCVREARKSSVDNELEAKLEVELATR